MYSFIHDYNSSYDKLISWESNDIINVNFDDNMIKIKNKQIKIVAVIPVFGRELLLRYTIRRLYTQNYLYKVICVGQSESEKNIVESEGGIWIQHNNNYLSEKWNIGFAYLKQLDFDAVLFVGSGDWVSSDWIPNVYDYIKDYGIIGKKAFDMIDITDGNIRTCHWLGNPKGLKTNRHMEPIGIGRLLSKSFIEKIEYKPFHDKINSRLDYSMFINCIKNNFRLKLIQNDSIFLSVSCDLWINKHKFNNHYFSKDKSFNELLKYFKSNGYALVYNQAKPHSKLEYLNILNIFPEIYNFLDDYKQMKK
jgi:hypothetical protein